MKLSLKEIAAATGGTLYGNDMTVTGLVTDSRAVKSGCMFAAFRGERVDGFDFIEKIDGDYNNVVGLPIARIYKELQNINACE